MLPQAASGTKFRRRLGWELFAIFPNSKMGLIAVASVLILLTMCPTGDCDIVKPSTTRSDGGVPSAPAKGGSNFAINEVLARPNTLSPASKVVSKVYLSDIDVVTPSRNRRGMVTGSDGQINGAEDTKRSIVLQTEGDAGSSPTTTNSQQIVGPQNGRQTQLNIGSTLAEATATGTATGLLVANLAAEARRNNAYRHPHVYESNQPYVPNNQYLAQAASGPTKDSDEIDEAAISRLPESIETLMGNDVDPEEQQEVVGTELRDVQAQGPNLVEDAEESQRIAKTYADGEDDNDQDDDIDGRSTEVPNRVIVQASQNHDTPAFLPPMLVDQNSLAPFLMDQGQMMHLRNSLTDLSSAGGHHHGYKKKKKKVIKKKKKKKKKVVKYEVKKIVLKRAKKVKKKKKEVKEKKKEHDHGKYYMYAKVPKKKSWEFGFKKGNKKHWIERHEKGHKNKFKTKVKWYDKKSKGKGFHIWDYNHHDKKKKKGHHK